MAAYEYLKLLYPKDWKFPEEVDVPVDDATALPSPILGPGANSSSHQGQSSDGVGVDGVSNGIPTALNQALQVGAVSEVATGNDLYQISTIPGKLGIVIESSDTFSGLIVTEIHHGSQLQGKVEVGDMIFKINNVEIRNEIDFQLFANEADRDIIMKQAVLPQPTDLYVVDGSSSFLECLGEEYRQMTVPQSNNTFTLEKHKIAKIATKLYMKFVLEKIAASNKNSGPPESDTDSDEPYSDVRCKKKPKNPSKLTQMHSKFIAALPF